MSGEKTNPNRRSVRLPNYDYTQAGAYFLTLVTFKRNRLFGNIVQGEMHLSPIGAVVKEVWLSIPAHFPHVSIGTFFIMPNHIHGILSINYTGDVQHVGSMQQRQARPLVQSWPPEKYEKFGKPVKGSIPTIIRSVKSEATRRVNLLRGIPGEKLWQRNYYEHVIRDDEDYQAIHDYIVTNPYHWKDDDEYIAP